MLLLEIALVFLKIGAIAIGGGYAGLPLFEDAVVNVKGYMTYQEFVDMLAIDELTPGPFAINIATFVGEKLAGIVGGIIASVSVIIPGCIISLILLKLYSKYKELKVVDGALSGLRCMVVALISSTALTFLINALFGSPNIIANINKFDIASLLLFAVALFILKKTKINPAIVVLGCGILGLLAYPFM